MDIYSYALKINQNHKHRQAMSMTLASGEVRKYTYDALFYGAHQYAEKFKMAGVSKGDRVILVGENSPGWEMAFLAIMEVKATVVLINPNESIEMIKASIQKADAICIVTTPKVKERLGEASYYRVPMLNLAKDGQAFEDSYNVLSPFMTKTEDTMPEMAMIFFEEDKQGNIRGILYTHQAMIENVLSAAQENQLSKSERILSIIPNCKIEGMVACVLGSLLTGAAVHYVEQLDEESLKNAFKWFKPTIWPAPKNILKTYKEKLESGLEGQRFDKEYLKRCKQMRQSMGVKLGNMLFKQLINELGGRLELIWCYGPIEEEVVIFYYALGIDLLVHYGRVETNTPVLGNRDEDMTLDTCGRPYPNMQVELRNPNAEGEGMLYVKSPYGMAGYFREDASVLAPIEDGWFNTGDLARLEEGTYVKVSYNQPHEALNTSQEEGIQIKESMGLAAKKNQAYYWFMAWKKTAACLYALTIKNQSYLPENEGCIIYTPLETERGFLGMTLGYNKEQFYKFGYLSHEKTNERYRLEEEAFGMIHYSEETLEEEVRKLCVTQLKKGWQLIVKAPRDILNAAFTDALLDLAKEAEVPIVPAYLQGENDVFFRQETFPKLFNLKHQKRYALELRYGKPLEMKGSKERIKKELEERMRALIANVVEEEPETKDELTELVRGLIETKSADELSHQLSKTQKPEIMDEESEVALKHKEEHKEEDKQESSNWFHDDLDDEMTERIDLSALLAEQDEREE